MTLLRVHLPCFNGSQPALKILDMFAIKSCKLVSIISDGGLFELLILFNLDLALHAKFFALLL